MIGILPRYSHLPTFKSYLKNDKFSRRFERRLKLVLLIDNKNKQDNEW
jgi:hypothetical protein